MKRSIVLFSVFALVFLFTPQAYCGFQPEEPTAPAESEKLVQPGMDDSEYKEQYGDPIASVTMDGTTIEKRDYFDPSMVNNEAGCKRLTSLRGNQYTAVVQNTGNADLAFWVVYDISDKSDRSFWGELTRGLVTPGGTQTVENVDLRMAEQLLLLKSQKPKKARTCGFLYNLFSSSDYEAGAKGTITIYKKSKTAA